MVLKYTIKDRAQIAARYEVWGSVSKVQDWWKELHGEDAILNPGTIKNCHYKLIEFGSVADLSRSGRGIKRDSSMINSVKVFFENNSSKSTRQASRELGIKRHHVLNILKKDLGWRAWKPHYLHRLLPGDCDKRRVFAESMLEWYEGDANVFNNIVWSDEAIFHVGGLVNRHNCHYWCEEDPKVITEKFMGKPKVTVWCGITSTDVIGPFLYEIL